ncbi:acyl-CoA thioesterase [Vibrio cholerae]|jgi:acyl-CoA thioester hydrolase|nr:acyl-CoA thioesterase [Vibrio cholerae]
MPSMRTFPVQLRFGDEDSYGHVNNVRFLQFLEDARVLLMNEPIAGGSLTELIDPDHYTLVGRQEIEYLAPLNFSTVPAAVDLWVTAIGGSSFDLGYAVRNRVEADASTTSALAATTMVLVSRSTGRPVRLTNDHRRILSTWLGPEVPFRRSRNR